MGDGGGKKGGGKNTYKERNNYKREPVYFFFPFFFLLSFPSFLFFLLSFFDPRVRSLQAAGNETYAKNGGDSCRRASFDAVAKFCIAELGYEARFPRRNYCQTKSHTADGVHLLLFHRTFTNARCR